MKASLLALLLGASVLSAQIRTDDLKPVAADDIAMPTLRDWQQKIVESYAKSGFAEVLFFSWTELPSPSLKKLFPGLRFFAISYSEHPAPGKSGGGLVHGISYTLICSVDGKLVKEIYHYGNYDEYGDFLASKGISIRSPEDAKLIWDGFCDLHQKGWRENPAVKLGDFIWHLGNQTNDGVHYYYEVVLNTAQKVTSAKLRADDPKRPNAK